LCESVVVFVQTAMASSESANSYIIQSPDMMYGRTAGAPRVSQRVKTGAEVRYVRLRTRGSA